MRKIVKRKNQEADVVACAWKLAVLLWHVLSSGEPFRYAQPKSLQAKYSRLRVRTTGLRRKSGIAKGTRKSPQYGQGRTRAVQSLPQVFAENGLPQPAALPRGEKIMLERRRLDTFCHELQTPSRVRPNEPARQIIEKEGDGADDLPHS
jgi:transposase